LREIGNILSIALRQNRRPPPILSRIRHAAGTPVTRRPDGIRHAVPPVPLHPVALCRSGPHGGVVHRRIIAQTAMHGRGKIPKKT